MSIVCRTPCQRPLLRLLLLLPVLGERPRLLRTAPRCEKRLPRLVGLLLLHPLLLRLRMDQVGAALPGLVCDRCDPDHFNASVAGGAGVATSAALPRPRPEAFAGSGSARSAGSAAAASSSTVGSETVRSRVSTKSGVQRVWPLACEPCFR